MIPSTVSKEDFNGSYGEEQAFIALTTLPDEYVVFHSVHWRKGGRNAPGEADFVIFHPKRGILVVEVKSGGIRRQNGIWRQQNTLTHKWHDMKDPMTQADRSKYVFCEMLEMQYPEIDDTPRVKNAIQPVVWFPSIAELPSNMPMGYFLDAVLLEKDLHTPLKSIERIFDAYQMWFIPGDAEQVMDIISPAFDVMPQLAVTIKEQDRVFHRMTREQSGLLDYLEEQRVAAIQGGAGTGKTMLAIEKAKRLAKSGKVLFLCYNKWLSQFLNKTEAAQDPNIEITHISLLTSNKTNWSESGDSQVITAYLNQYDEFGWDYRHIVIDEGQDMQPEHVRLLSAIAEINDGSFYVFYDRNQLVQQREGLEWLNAMDCRLVLSKNCRNTKSIAVTSYGSIGIPEEKVRMMNEDIPGEKPRLFIVDSEEKVIERIAECIRDYYGEGIALSDMVILTVQTEAKSILNGISNVGGYKLTRQLGEPGILFTTSRKFKGLERSVVIVIDLNENSFADEEAKRVLYVGTSRAKNHLDFVAVLNEDQLSSIAREITGTRQREPLKAIRKIWKVRPQLV